MDAKYKLQNNNTPDYGGANSGAIAAAKQNLRIAEDLDAQLVVAADYRSEYIAINAGLRAVVRSLLAQVRELDPNNKLLIKKNREWVFRQFETAEIERLNKEREANGLPRIRPRLSEEFKNGF